MPHKTAAILSGSAAADRGHRHDIFGHGGATSRRRMLDFGLPMSTAAAAPTRRIQSVGAHDRKFYTGMAVALALTAFIGFAPSYYLRPLFGATQSVTGATSLPPLVHVHGAIFTAWVVLFIVQTALVASHRVQLHRKLGIAGGVLASIMVLVGVATAIKAAERGSAPPGVDPLVFLAIPLTDMVLFAGFVAAALRMRRDKEAHKRLMLVAYVSIIVAAVARFPGVLPHGPLAFFGLTCVFLVVAALYDLVSRRSIHPAYLWGGGLFVISVPLRLMASGTSAWRSFAEFLTGLI